MESHINRVILSCILMYDKLLERFEQTLDNDLTLSPNEKREKYEEYMWELNREKSATVRKFLEDCGKHIYD